MAGMTVLLLLLWAGVTVSSPVDLQKRIVGGKNCDDNRHKYHVYLEVKTKNRVEFCGGSLIHKEWVLTAAHCWTGTVTAFLGVHPGLLNLQSKEVGIKGLMKYTDSNNRLDDLLLVKIKPSSSITPIDLPTKDECQHRSQITEVEVAGYGGMPFGGMLQCENFKKISSDQEVQEMKTAIVNSDEYKSYIYEKIFCYSHTTAFTAKGDSGGGVVYQKKLYGVHVMGLKDRQSGVTNGVAMDLCNEAYRVWITNKTKIQFN